MESIQLRDSVVPKLLKKVDAQGYLRSKARIARVGVQYYEKYGNVMRTEKEVRDSAASFNNQIVTYEHPDGSATSANSKDLAIGFITNVSFKGKWLVGDVVITDSNAVKSILDGVATEFSCGYTAKLREVKGDYLGESYEREVYGIVGNHVSLVSEARAGSEATFTDSTKTTLEPREGTGLNTMENHTPDFASLNDSITQLMSRLEALEAKIDTMSKTEETVSEDAMAGTNGMCDSADVVETNDLVDEKDEKIAALEAKVDILTDSLDKVKDVQPEVIYDGAEIAARVEVWSFVKPLLKDSVDIDYGMDVSSVRKLYLAEKLPQLAAKIKEGSSAYVKGLWDGIVGVEPVPVAVPVKDSVDIKDAVDALSQEANTESSQEAARQAYIDRLAANRG